MIAFRLSVLGALRGLTYGPNLWVKGTKYRLKLVQTGMIVPKLATYNLTLMICSNGS